MINAESDSITIGNNRFIAKFAARLAVCFISGTWLDTTGPIEFKDAIAPE